MKTDRYVNKVPGSDSNLLKVMSVLPTRVRPYLIAFEVYSAWRNRQRMRDARQVWQQEYTTQMQKHQEKTRGRRGGGLVRLLLGAGLAYGVTQLLKTQNQGRVRSTEFMPERETAGTTSTSGKVDTTVRPE